MAKKLDAVGSSLDHSVSAEHTDRGIKTCIGDDSEFNEVGVQRKETGLKILVSGFGQRDLEHAMAKIDAHHAMSEPK